MTEDQPTPRYDLEDRTYRFAKRVRAFVKRLPRTIYSVGANYIEANEALSRKDFKMRIKICRKESKESAYHLRLLDTGECTELDKERDWLIEEASQFVKIFNAILAKCE